MAGDKEHRHIVSDLKEEHRWGPLAQENIPIYNQEVIVGTIFKQELPEWDDPDPEILLK